MIETTRPSPDQLQHANIRIMQSSGYEAWKLNNGQSGDIDKTITNFNTFAKDTFTADNGLDLGDPASWPRMPGLAYIPACDWSTWEVNFWNYGLQHNTGERCATYPCCPKDTLPPIKRGSDE